VAGSDYDTAAYPPGAYPQSHPDRLAAIGMLLGMDAPPIDGCRVLEIGCGDGSNLIPMAVGLPRSTFFGIDLAAAPIERGRVLMAAAGLKNVRLEPMNLLEFPADSGAFDYIIAHGFYSWTPDLVRVKMWEVMADRLSANGVAYVSYNAYPAGYFRNAARDMMGFHLGVRQTPDAERALTGREFIATLARHSTGKRVWKTVLEFESERLNKRRLAVLRHDELGDNYAPFQFSDVAAAADAAGFQYLAEASLRRLFTPVDPPLQKALDELAPAGLIEREQYLDYLEFRSFRESLFCRNSVSLEREGAGRRMSKAWLASPLCKSGNQFRDSRSNGAMETNDPAVIGLLERLSAIWPSAERFEDLPGDSGIGQLVSAGLVDLRTHPLVPLRVAGRIPVASPLARAQFAVGTRATNLLHGTVEMVDAGARRTICRLDGTQTLRSLERLFAGAPGGVDAALGQLYRHGLLLY